MPTPSSQTRKRKSTASAVTDDETTPNKSASPSAGGSSSAKKRATRGKNKSDTVKINLDIDDPFSFDSKADTHPEPLKNISVERTAFGGVKFSRSPPSSSERYASLEKMAERRGNISGLSTSPARPSPLSSLSTGLQMDVSSSSVTSRSSTPKSKIKKRGVVNQSSSEAYQMDEDDEKDSADESIKGKTSPNKNNANDGTPSSGKRRSKSSAFAEAAASIYEQKKSNTEELYKVPELNPIEQLEVDHATEEHQLLAPGARVLALWGHEFYAAYICGRDGLSRYFVHFVEDDLNRLLPPTGVIPLAMLSAGHQVSFISSVDDEEVGKTAEIINAPSCEDAEEWVEGLFEVREDEAEEEKGTNKISWEKIYLSKEQSAKINVKPVNTTVFIDRENIVNESRSSRRSRTTRFSTESLATAVGNTPAQDPSSSRAGRASRTPRTPKTPAIAVDSGEASEGSPKSSGKKRGRGRKSVPSKPSTPASRSTPRRKAKEVDAEMEEEPEEMETEEEPAKEEEDGSGEKEEEAAEDESPAVDNKMEVSIEEQLTPPAGEEEQNEMENDAEAEEPLSTQEVPEVMNGTGEGSFNADKMNGSSVAEKEQEAEKQEEEEKNKSNGSPAKPVNTSSQQSMTAMEFLHANDGPNDPTAANNTATSPPNNKSSTPVAAASAVENTPTTPSSSSTTKPVKSNIFENMKFVLTSATRSKKSSDFNKRDYRTKIEDRGGEMIEDFSALKQGDKAFLIADTYYRTHKYLSALSLSVPCVKHNWISECVSQECLVDHVPFMLPAGESTLDPSQINDWKPLKGNLLQNKRVWVYSNVDTKGDERTLGFVDIWSSIIGNLGAELVADMPLGIVGKLERCREDPVNILLSDVTCEKAIAERVEAEGGIAVSSEWVIQAIVTGELPDVSTSERFRFDSAA